MGAVDALSDSIILSTTAPAEHQAKRHYNYTNRVRISGPVCNEFA